MASELRLTRDLAEPVPIPAAGIARALDLMRTGRLFRYGETGADGNDAALLEQEFAALIGRRFCVAVNSGGTALFLALKLLGVAPGDTVLVNGFTLAPVPGAILHANARPVLVETGPDLTIDLADLRRKAQASGARILLLSHMRGHIAAMDRIVALCAELGLALVEDCAHALGASFAGQAIGTFGLAAAFSAQGYKHLNAGEGGLLVLDDPDLCARAVLHSGSYMLHGQHLSRPGAATMMRWEEETPNFSLRMTALAAALLRPQLAELPDRVARWRAIHDRIALRLAASPQIELPARHPGAEPAPTSVQFLLKGLDACEIERFVARGAASGVPIKWFGAARQHGFTSAPRHWRYARQQDDLVGTHEVLARLCDIRTPLSLSDEDCDLIGETVHAALAERESEDDGARRC
jgi:dTDP-4-amino-4,6-dideoxygalactose transaminase